MEPVEIMPSAPYPVRIDERDIPRIIAETKAFQAVDELTVHVYRSPEVFARKEVKGLRYRRRYERIARLRRNA